MQTYNLQICQGSTFSIRTFATNSNGTYINLSGYSARGQVRSRFSDSGILLNLNPTVDTSYISGIVNISISGSQTTGINCGVFPYDCEIYNIDESSVIKILRGYAEISSEITR
jgi:hypothetical protein